MAMIDLEQLETAMATNIITPEALFELGRIHSSGRNGQVDIVAAHKWFNIAAYKGFDEAKTYRDEIASELSSAEMVQAQKAAREWLQHN